MTRLIRSSILSSCLLLSAGCSVLDKSESFTFTADLPPHFAYVATAYYIPAEGQSCKLAKADNLADQFNRHWRTEYTPDAQVELRRTSKGCKLELDRLELEINATYGKDRGDFGSDFGNVAVRSQPFEKYPSTFNTAGESEFFGQCQWLFRTVGGLRRIVKLLDCRNTDAQGNIFGARPLASYKLEDLAGKTVRLKIKLADEERPGWGDTWVKVPNGWKRCMGKRFEDQHAYCFGNYTDFSTFRMPDGRVCDIYPGCTEKMEVAP